MLRFWNNEVLDNPDGTQTVIATICAGFTPTQTLPHHGGGRGEEGKGISEKDVNTRQIRSPAMRLLHAAGPM